MTNPGKPQQIGSWLQRYWEDPEKEKGKVKVTRRLVIARSQGSRREKVFALLSLLLLVPRCLGGTQETIFESHCSHSCIDHFRRQHQKPTKRDFSLPRALPRSTSKP